MQLAKDKIEPSKEMIEAGEEVIADFSEDIGSASLVHRIWMAMARSQWKPIATAPQGKTIWVYFPPDKNHPKSDQGSAYFDGAIWCDGLLNTGLSGQPTYWMDLPPHPSP